MTDETTQKLIDWARDVTDAVRPEIIQLVAEYIRYGIVSGLFIGILCAIAALAIYIKGKKLDPTNYDYEFYRGVVYLVVANLLVISVFNINTAIKAYIAPRVYIIDKLKG